MATLGLLDPAQAKCSDFGDYRKATSAEQRARRPSSNTGHVWAPGLGACERSPRTDVGENGSRRHGRTRRIALWHAQGSSTPVRRNSVLAGIAPKAASAQHWPGARVLPEEGLHGSGRKWISTARVVARSQGRRRIWSPGVAHRLRRPWASTRRARARGPLCPARLGGGGRRWLAHRHGRQAGDAGGVACSLGPSLGGAPRPARSVGQVVGLGRA